jgi:rare lipoprotein A
MKRLAALLLPLLLAGCPGFRKPLPPSTPHYVLGDPYQAGGIWYYPRASYTAEQTGLAVIYGSGHPPLTSDGERFDQAVLAAAHQTLQLPAVARVTNLENGKQVVVRVNDRGPAAPNRLFEVTRRTSELLGFPASGVARVRLEVLPEASHAAVDALGGAPEERLEIAAAPHGAVQATDLPPRGKARGTQPVSNVGRAPPAAAGNAATPIPLRMPEKVTETVPQPGSFWVQMGSFSRREFAEHQRAVVAGLGPEIEASRIGREETYRVRIGPFARVAEADAALEQVIRAGVTDARIVVE